MKESLRAPHTSSLKESPRAPYTSSLKESLRAPYTPSLKGSRRAPHTSSLEESLRAPHTSSFKESLRANHTLSMNGSLRAPDTNTPRPRALKIKRHRARKNQSTDPDTRNPRSGPDPSTMSSNMMELLNTVKGLNQTQARERRKSSSECQINAP